MTVSAWQCLRDSHRRTVKMLLAEKQFTAFNQVPLNVLAGDPETHRGYRGPRKPCGYPRASAGPMRLSLVFARLPAPRAAVCGPAA